MAIGVSNLEENGMYIDTQELIKYNCWPMGRDGHLSPFLYHNEMKCSLRH